MYNYWYLGACKLTLIGLKLQSVISMPLAAPNGIYNDCLTVSKPGFLNFHSVLHCSAKQEVPSKTQLSQKPTWSTKANVFLWKWLTYRCLWTLNKDKTKHFCRYHNLMIKIFAVTKNLVKFLYAKRSTRAKNAVCKNVYIKHCVNFCNLHSLFYFFLKEIHTFLHRCIKLIKTDKDFYIVTM